MTSTSEKKLEPVLQDALRSFLEYVSSVVGRDKAVEFLQESYRRTQKYYSPISLMQLDENMQLSFEDPKINEKEILGFSLWMEKFLKMLSSFMIGIGKIRPEEILGDVAADLRPAGFFDYFEHSRELKY